MPLASVLSQHAVIEGGLYLVPKPRTVITNAVHLAFETDNADRQLFHEFCAPRRELPINLANLKTDR